MAELDFVLDKVKTIQSLREERGSVLVLTVLLLPIMLGCLGFAYDFGNLYMHRARLQNVADAAALAGARAYLDSQATESKDTIDGTVDKQSEQLNAGGVDITGRTEYSYVPTSNPLTRIHGNSQHQAADNAADTYIYKNIFNLGNEVKSDKWSHYVLNSSAGVNAKTFYRIGLSEEVQLFFLPIIKNIPKTQVVRVGAVSLLEPGTTSNPGDGNVRLINFRMEFQEKNPDGTTNSGEKDPFIYLSLDGTSY